MRRVVAAIAGLAAWLPLDRRPGPVLDRACALRRNCDLSRRPHIGHEGRVGEVPGEELGEPRPADRRADATTALSSLLAANGAWGVRVHDVAGSADAVRVVAALEAAKHGRDVT